LIFGRFCLGSYLFLLLTGQARFANRTLPMGSDRVTQAATRSFAIARTTR
jgi:hypothetical protein